MANQAQGSLTLRRIRNGKTLSIVLSPNALLVQFVQEQGGSITIAPDWTIPANQPTVTPIVSASGGAIITLSDHQWRYNDAIITSSDNRFVLNANGSIKIVQNIASATNLHTDTLSYTGIANVDGSVVRVSKAVDIEIRKAGVNEYIGEIYSTLGTVIGDKVPSISLGTKLFQGVTELSNYSVKWYADATYLTGKDGKTLTVTRDMVNGSQLFIAEFLTANGTVVDRGSINISDIADTYKVVLASSKGNTLSEDDSSTIVTATITKNNQPYTPTTSPTWKLTKYHADDLTEISNVAVNNIEVVAADFLNNGKDVEVEVVGEVTF